MFLLTFHKELISISTFGYLVKTIFVHYDDSNPQIQKCAENVLKIAASQNKIEFLNVAKSIQAFQHPVLLNNLIEFVQFNIQ